CCQKRDGEQWTVHRHQNQCTDEKNCCQQSANSLLDGKLANLPRTIEPALNVTCPATREISHWKGEKLPAQEIENHCVKSYSRKGQQIFLGQSGELHEDDGRDQAEQDRLQEPDIVFENDPIEHHPVVALPVHYCRQGHKWEIA